MSFNNYDIKAMHNSNQYAGQPTIVKGYTSAAQLLKLSPERKFNAQLDKNSQLYKNIVSALGVEKDAAEYTGVTSTASVSNIIALARNRGVTSEDIKNVLNKYTSTREEWTVDTIRDLNNKECPDNYQWVVNRINSDNPDAGAYVYKTMDAKGNTNYTIRYKNSDGENVPYRFKDDDTFSESMSSADLNVWYQNSPLKFDSVTDTQNKNTASTNDAAEAARLEAEREAARLKAEQEANARANAQSQIDLGNKIIEALSGGVGTSANAFRDLTSEERAAVTATAPSTSDLKAWNQSKDANIFNTIMANRQSSNPDLVERASLEDLQGLANSITDEQISVTQRNLNNQKLQTLQSIIRDPELYNAVIQQLRADAGAGTIAGQRAANAQRVASEVGATYDTTANKLYESLFSGENNVAQGTYANAYGGAKSALEQYITGALNNAMSAERQKQIASQDLQTFLSGLSTALGVDLSKYADAVVENAAAADGKANEILNQATNDAKADIANNDAALNDVIGALGLGESYLNQASDGSADVAAAVQTLLDAIGNNTYTSEYKTVDAGDYEKAAQLDNKQYTDIVNSADFQRFLTDNTIDSMTKADTLDELRSKYGLDQLTETGLNELYKGFADDAANKANRIFNDAQRAYIAAISAGDVKTADQLTKLAANANSASKGNLFAASALSEQFKQQTGANSLGSQLATDFLNQQSFNRVNANNAALDANAALIQFLGNGSDTFESGTLYGVLNTNQQTAATNRQHYGQFGEAVMNTTQGLNSETVKNQVNNYDRLQDLANGLTDLNAAAAVNNTANKATTNTYLNRANALVSQGNTTLNNLKK